jgi:cysteine desulfurase
MLHRIYCDHNATTPPDQRVVERISDVALRVFGNPSSPHRAGQEAKGILEESRHIIAEFLGAKEQEIAFTSSGTEADNLAVFGVAHALRDRGRHVITTAVEHHAVLSCTERLYQSGWEVTVLSVDSSGMLTRISFAGLYGKTPSSRR